MIEPENVGFGHGQDIKGIGQKDNQLATADDFAGAGLARASMSSSRPPPSPALTAPAFSQGASRGRMLPAPVRLERL